MFYRFFSKSGSSWRSQFQRRFYYRPWIRVKNIQATPLWKPVTFALGMGFASFSVAHALDARKQQAKKITSFRGRRIHQPSSKKIVLSIVGVNAAVLLLWKLRPYGKVVRFLDRYTIMNPVRTTLPSMLLSAFSHQSNWHFAVNMIAFYSFAPSVVDVMGPNQFLAFFTTSVLASNLVSIFHHRLRFGSAMTPGSLGASGAVYAIAAATSYFFPNASVSIIFLPFIPIRIGVALLGLMAFDAWGLINRSRFTFIDHAAHLGGGIFGWLYAKYGYSAYKRSLRPPPPPAVNSVFRRSVSW
ncbi:rhomboid protease [Schizosaccharomyces japonicus yFS275]|uniref:Rhomboid protease n=1 Tax=Schizosaccharomyces japonicus (strain yFS275 / FY16936) TaxID=402676 RepID=B6K3D7_SCHJY|nr:rhomboid protease [Schizosaccharomyces japonicus yFS275]EEB07994.1 rhomboid protease [Schizosaccharomyces japonicus yFS275]